MTFAARIVPVQSSRFNCGEPVRKRGEAARKSGPNRRLPAEMPPKIHDMSIPAK
jgi:antitoxin (DNA-binding transcriptional repressor) of toxin-antitoxin stability system